MGDNKEIVVSALVDDCFSHSSRVSAGCSVRIEIVDNDDFNATFEKLAARLERTVFTFAGVPLPKRFTRGGETGSHAILKPKGTDFTPGLSTVISSASGNE